MFLSFPRIKTLTGVLCAIAAVVLCQQDASAKNIYVSPSGSGTDGSSWANAWQDPAKIDWTKVAAGDQIVLDGGPSGITYTTSFTVPVSGVVIRQASQAGHNGQVTLQGLSYPSRPSAQAIKITGSNVRVVGVRRSGIKLTRYAEQGVSIQSNNNVLQNIEISVITGYQPYAQGKVGGLTFGGFNNHFIGCDFRDTLNGAVSKPLPGTSNLAVFRNCTFGSSYYGFWAANGASLLGSRDASGAGATALIYADRCVFGPYVDYGVDSANDNVVLSNCMFLGAKTANLNVVPSSGTPSVSVSHCTFYERKLQILQPLPYGIPQNTIFSSGNNNLNIRNSIVYGGLVNVPPSQAINGGGNIQYAVTGNTVALSASLVDPQFVDNAELSAALAPVAYVPRTLTTLSFAPTAAAAQGKGAAITRVADMVAPYGPTSGLPGIMGGP